MRSMSLGSARPWDLCVQRRVSLKCCTAVQPKQLNVKGREQLCNFSLPEKLISPVPAGSHSFRLESRPVNLGKKWKEYQGIKNWDGLLDPLDDNLRDEILRYGRFVEATYNSFDFDPSSPSYATCRYPRNSLLRNSGNPQTGYKITKNLHATSGIQLPRWMEKAPSWISTQSSWIGYVAVCEDEKEIARLGRRDVVIAYRGTATCLEWLENLRATLTSLSENCWNLGPNGCGPMVESGFLSLYSSKTATAPSLQEMIREEISRVIKLYGDEPLSLTITGHSLGAALAILTAYDIKTTFQKSPLVSVISFGGPRVGNQKFRQHLDERGTKILRIVNSDDVITKVPGFVLDNENENEDDNQNHNQVAYNRDIHVAGLLNWIQKRIHDTQWVYSEVGQELRLRSKDSPYLNGGNIVTCHDLKTYLHLVDGFVSSTCPFRATARRILKKQKPLTSLQ